MKKIQRSWLLCGLATILVLFATLRHNVGFQDYDIYVNSYSEVVINGLKSLNDTIFEPGFVFVYYLCSFLSEAPVFGLFVIAFIAVVLNLSCYCKYTSYFFVAVLLYFVHTFVLREMIQIRAGVAASICLYSLRFVEQQEVRRFVLTICIAMLFHLASAIFLSVYWLCRLNWGRKTWIKLVILSFVVGLVMPMGKFLTNIPSGGLGARISTYTWMIGSHNGGILNATVLKQLFFVSCGLIFWNTLNERVPHFKVLLVCLIMSLCWLLVWNDFPIVANRLATFFSITEVLIVPSFLYLFNSKSRFMAIIAIVFYAFLTLWLNIKTGNFILYQDYQRLVDIL